MLSLLGVMALDRRARGGTPGSKFRPFADRPRPFAQKKIVASLETQTSQRRWTEMQERVMDEDRGRRRGQPATGIGNRGPNAYLPAFIRGWEMMKAYLRQLYSIGQGAR